jgi:hypothetical protein
MQLMSLPLKKSPGMPSSRSESISQRELDFDAAGNTMQAFFTAFLRERIFKSPQIELGICSWSRHSVQMRK